MSSEFFDRVELPHRRVRKVVKTEGQLVGSEIIVVGVASVMMQLICRYYLDLNLK